MSFTPTTPPHCTKVICHWPEVMTPWGQLLAEVWRPMDKRCFEFATLLAAHELACVTVPAAPATQAPLQGDLHVH